MGLLDAYEDSANTALKVMESRPPEIEKPKAKHSAWSAPFRAVAAGGAEVLGNVIDVAAAAGQVSASVGGITPGFDAQKNRQQSVEAMDTLKTDGINWRTDEGQQAYKFGADLRPDPQTAGTAENLVFSLTKGLTKAIGSAATLGPVAGAAAFGASEGMTASEDLATQGVDLETRSKVGAVTAGFNAAGVLLPVAGQTLKQTAGLVAVGGPLSFMAQQQATRSILENADYGEIAQQYDPLDPVGLTVSTLLPAGFAAYAKRGAFTGKQKASQEAVDAAMVQNLTAVRDLHEEISPGAKPMADFEPLKPIQPDPTVKEDLTVQPAAQETPDAYQSRVDALLKDQPDIVARLDDSGQPVKLADELAAIKKQAQEGTDTEFGAMDAPLLKVAAECALSIGTAGL